MKLQFNRELNKILDIYAPDWIKDPLDGDEVEILAEMLKDQLNLLNGNMTRREYENKMK